MKRRFLFLVLAISISYLINTYYIDHLLNIFKIMSNVALILNRVSLALLCYLIFEVIFIDKKIIWDNLIAKSFLVYFIWLIGLLFGRVSNLADYRLDEHFNFSTHLPKWINHWDNPLVRYYIVGNILVYLPFGFFICYYKNLKYSILYCLLLIILFETLQGVSNLGYFDIDDILLNSIGGLMGILLMKGFKAFFLAK